MLCDGWRKNWRGRATNEKRQKEESEGKGRMGQSCRRLTGPLCWDRLAPRCYGHSFCGFTVHEHLLQHITFHHWRITHFGCPTGPHGYRCDHTGLIHPVCPGLSSCATREWRTTFLYTGTMSNVQYCTCTMYNVCTVVLYLPEILILFTCSRSSFAPLAKFHINTSLLVFSHSSV